MPARASMAGQFKERAGRSRPTPRLSVDLQHWKPGHFPPVAGVGMTKPGTCSRPAAMKTAAIIVAAGNGTRAGGSVPKQFAPLAGKPMLAHSYAAMTSHPAMDAVLVVIGEGQ